MVELEHDALNGYYAQYGRDNLGGYLAPVEIEPEYAAKIRNIWRRYFCKSVRRRLCLKKS